MRKCPHCGSELVDHKGVNEGFAHCNTCGCCFEIQTRNLREGTLACTMVQSQEAREDQQQLQSRIRELEGQVRDNPAVAEADALRKELKAQQEANEKLVADLAKAAAKATDNK